MAVLRLIANSLAPLTLLAAIVAFLFPPSFLIFKDSFLWFFAVTMFALGVVIDPNELQRTIARPQQIALGLATQYSVMPLLGFSAAYLSGLEPEVALGFVIVGCAPGAMASNVIVYLAGGAVAFSVALTTFATLLSPLITPSLVKLLGGVFLPIPFWPMMKTIILTVLLPLAAGMMARRLASRRIKIIRDMAPAVAVIAIIVIIGYAVAANRETLGDLGLMVFFLVVLLNLLGYLAGWYLAGLYRFDHRSQVALMIEIGMQNAGLGVALALEHFDSETALPGVLFATWCILTAAGATSYLRKKAETIGRSKV
jgi:BASS family bile acid:Na+ symporter